MQTIGFIGLGAMGSRMAKRLLEAGYRLQVYNRSPDPAAQLAREGATVAPTPRAAAENADIAIVMVTDDAASRHVWLDPETGALAGLPSTAVAIESSTVSPDWIKELAAAIAARGVSFLEAPVVGTRPQADAGELIHLIGGDAGTLERVEEVLHAQGSKVVPAGDHGQAAVLKLMVNALLAAQAAIWSELLGYAERSGFGKDRAAAYLQKMPVASPIMERIVPLLLGKEHNPNFPVDLVIKDLSILTQGVQSVGGRAPGMKAIEQTYRAASEAGHGRLDITGIARMYL